jgi:hypothetical protein
MNSKMALTTERPRRKQTAKTYDPAVVSRDTKSGARRFESKSTRRL